MTLLLELALMWLAVMILVGVSWLVSRPFVWGQRWHDRRRAGDQ